MAQHESLICYNFNQAAVSYLAAAVIQREPAEQIFKELAAYYQGGYLLDLGSGPGTLFHLSRGAITDSKQLAYSLKGLNLNLEQLISLDLSLAMLQQNPLKRRVNADVVRLPFCNNSFAVIFSNLMLQWPRAKEQAFSEIARILASGGHLLFTTLLKPSLAELANAWAQVDTHSHTLKFLTVADYLALCYASGFKVIQLKQFSHTEYFASINDLFRHFKLTGTSLPKSFANVGLGGRKLLNKLEMAYQRDPVSGQLPLSYHYLFMVVQKEAL